MTRAWVPLFGLLLISALGGCDSPFDVEVLLVRHLDGASSNADDHLAPKQIDCLWLAYCLQDDKDPDRCGKDSTFEDEYQFVRLENDDREGPGPDILGGIPPDKTVSLYTTATYRLADGSGSELVKGQLTNVKVSDIRETNGKKQLVINLVPCAAPEQCWERCPAPE